MSAKIASEAQNRAQEIHAALMSEGGEPNKQPPANPEKPGEGKDAADAAAPVVVNDTAVLQAEVAQWQHRYSVLQGKYNAEVPRLNAQVKALQEQLATLEGKSREAAKGTVNDALSIVREELGDRVADSVATLLANGGQQPPAAAPAATTDAPAAPAPSNEEEAAIAIEHVRTTVDSAVNRPGTFDQVNEDPAFTAYLTQTLHAPSQQSMKVHMDKSFIAGDLASVARVFLAFINMRSAQAKAEADAKLKGAATPDVPVGAAPAGGHGDGQRTYTHEEYAVTMKSLLHDPQYRTSAGQATATRIRQELLTALRDGRVV